MSDTTEELDDVAANALASIILERTADTLHDDGNAAALALVALTADTGLPYDVTAGILVATSFLAGAGRLDAQEVFAAALALKPDDGETAAP